MRPILMFATLISLLGPNLSRAGEASPAVDTLVSAGHEFALKVCAACHIVAKDQAAKPILKPAAPNFFIIARREKTTDANLRRFLSAPHGKMPNPELADFQIDEVVAYVLSLKRGK